MRSVAPVPLLIRAALAVSGIGLILAPERLNALAVVLTVAGLLGALARPDGIGAGPATAGFVLAWIAASGWDADPSLPRTVVAAASLYLLHAATALAAVVPLGARVDPAVLRRSGLRSLLVVAGAAGVVAADYALERRHGSPALELIGLLAVLVLVAVPVRRALRGGSARVVHRH